MDVKHWSKESNPRYRVYTVKNFRTIPQIARLSESKRRVIEVVAQVFPFKVNNYVVEQLIDWTDHHDPLFVLTFPQRDMLLPEHFRKMEDAYCSGNREIIRKTVHQIRLKLNPHPAGQMEFNVPRLSDGTLLRGMQHKYKQTVLFFPSQGQTCHAYCSFCFRWPQFVGMQNMRFAMREAGLLVQYLKEHPEVTDVLFTGGDPMMMKTSIFSAYVDAVLNADLPELKTIRIGTKALSYWPYRFLSENDSKELLDVFRRITERNKHLALMAHVNHPRELQTEAVRAAIAKIRQTGAVIRTQSPLMAHINDSAQVWAEMWELQANLGCIPYFMFSVRNTGAQHYFAVPLVKGWQIFRDAKNRVSGLARTARGFSMSALPGKIKILGTPMIQGRKYIALTMIQAREESWAYRPFFAEYDEEAVWISDLKPAFGAESFFYEDELAELVLPKRKASLQIVGQRGETTVLRFAA